MPERIVKGAPWHGWTPALMPRTVRATVRAYAAKAPSIAKRKAKIADLEDRRRRALGHLAKLDAALKQVGTGGRKLSLTKIRNAPNIAATWRQKVAEYELGIANAQAEIALYEADLDAMLADIELRVPAGDIRGYVCLLPWLTIDFKVWEGKNCLRLRTDPWNGTVHSPPWPACGCGWTIIRRIPVGLDGGERRVALEVDAVRRLYGPGGEEIHFDPTPPKDVE